MSKKDSSSQRRKHEKIEEEFLRSRLSLADIDNADSVTLEAYQILENTGKKGSLSEEESDQAARSKTRLDEAIPPKTRRGDRGEEARGAEV